MSSNSDVIRKFLEVIIKVGSDITSKDFIKLVLTKSISENSKKYAFLKYIEVSENVFVDKKIDEISKEEIIEPINKLFDYLFLDPSKKVLRASIDEQTIRNFKEFGFNI